MPNAKWAIESLVLKLGCWWNAPVGMVKWRQKCMQYRPKTWIARCSIGLSVAKYHLCFRLCFHKGNFIQMTVCKSKIKCTPIWNKWQVVGNEVQCNASLHCTVVIRIRAPSFLPFLTSPLLQRVARSGDWQGPDCGHFVRLLFHRANISAGSKAYNAENWAPVHCSAMYNN